MHASLPAPAVCPKAKRAAERALDLNDTLGAAPPRSGSCWRRRWDWQNAEREYRRALQLNPADASARGLFGNCCLSPQRRFDEAFTELTHAVALDPLSLSINSGLAGLLHEREEFDSAIEHQMKTIQLDPNFYFADFNLGRTYSIMGRHEESLKAFERAAALQPTSTYVRCLMAREFALLGRATMRSRS